MEFPRFYYNSNVCWGWVESVENLKEKMLLQIDPSGGTFITKDEFLDKSYQHSKVDLEFGSYREHNGKKTLREFLKENNIEF